MNFLRKDRKSSGGVEIMRPHQTIESDVERTSRSLKIINRMIRVNEGRFGATPFIFILRIIEKSTQERLGQLHTELKNSDSANSVR